LFISSFSHVITIMTTVAVTMVFVCQFIFVFSLARLGIGTSRTSASSEEIAIGML
jgi:hypothetical protein